MSRMADGDPEGTVHAPPASIRTPENLILGIDPGLQTTGYAVLRFTDGPASGVGMSPCSVAEAGVVRASPKESLGNRVQAIYQGVREVLESFRPCAVALEELYSHYEMPRTAILMGHARGVICLAASQGNVPVVGYSATQVKKILTGNGRAPKSQVQQAIQRELRLPRLPEPADVADALAIALCHYYLQQRSPQILASTAGSLSRKIIKKL